jgi:lactoylglutathione lyase
VRYLHTMLRVRNLDDALDFYCKKLGLKEVRRRVDEKNRYTLVFLAAPEDEPLVEQTKKRSAREAPLVELTYNWDTEDYGEARHFGHLAYEVDDIYATCEKLMKAGVTINRPPRDGMMAFVRSPDRHSIELLQKGSPLPPKEPWTSMPNTGKWEGGFVGWVEWSETHHFAHRRPRTGGLPRRTFASPRLGRRFSVEKCRFLEVFLKMFAAEIKGLMHFNLGKASLDC